MTDNAHCFFIFALVGIVENPRPETVYKIDPVGPVLVQLEQQIGNYLIVGDLYAAHVQADHFIKDAVQLGKLFLLQALLF